MKPMQPLSKRTRTLLWWLLAAAFVIGTPLLIGYANGYRFDDALSLVHTGGIYLHSDMSRTRVYLDGEYVEANGALFKNTLIQNLRPNRTYEVWVERDGYASWTKELPVKRNFVTEAAVLMLPRSFTWEQVPATTTLHLHPSATSTASTSVVVTPRHQELIELFSEVDEQFAIEYATTTIELVQGREVATTTFYTVLKFPEWFATLASSTMLHEQQQVRERDGIVTWLDDGNMHAVWGRENDAPPYYFCNATCAPMLTVDWEEDITYYDFYPNRNDVVIVAGATGIYAVELDERSQRNIQPFIEESGLAFRLTDDDELVVFDGEQFRVTTW